MTTRPPRQTSFSELARLLGHFKELGFDNASLLVRTVATKTADKWYNFGTSVSLTDDHEPFERVIRLRNDVALVEFVVLLDANLSDETLMHFLARWRHLLDIERDFTFQSNVYLHRFYSDPRVGAIPGWHADLSENLPDRPSFPLPDGPFLNEKEQIFGSDLPHLAAIWLGDDYWAQQHSLTHNYRIRIPDRRAKLVALEADDQRLTVTIERNTLEPLHCCVIPISFSGQSHQLVKKVEATQSMFEFPFSVQAIQVWVTLDDGYPLDHYNESPTRASWGSDKSLYNAPPRTGALLHAITDALNGGETETVEFKPYIKLRQRDKKADELWKVVCAFANANGGDLYIGVNDYGEPIGIDRDLRTEYGKDCSGDVQSMQDAYVRDLKKLLNEGLAPAAMPEFKWHDIAHRLVLQACVHRSSTLVHLIVNGEMFKRIGATNRKLRPSDISRNKNNE